MTTSHSAFVGSIPDYYDQYLGPLIFEDYAADLAQRVSVSPSGTLLEIAAGTGIATRHLQHSLPPTARLVVTDLNEDMLACARRKFGPKDRAELLATDATRLAFADASFDTAVCQFSLMFFPDKLAALLEVARVLKPGGVFLFSLWDTFAHNHLVRTVNDSLVRLFPENPPHFFDTPYGFHRIDDVKTFWATPVLAILKFSCCPAPAAPSPPGRWPLAISWEHPPAGRLPSAASSRWMKSSIKSNATCAARMARLLSRQRCRQL